MPRYVETRDRLIPRSAPDPAINGRAMITPQVLKSPADFATPARTQVVGRVSKTYLGHRPRVGSCTRDLQIMHPLTADAERSHLAQGITNENAQVHDG